MAFRRWTSKATRRRDGLRQMQQGGVAAIVVAGLAVTLLTPLPLASVLAYLTAACVGVLAYRGRLGTTLLTAGIAIAAYLAALQVTQSAPSNSLILAIVVLFGGAAAVAASSGAMRADERVISRSSSPNCVGYDVFTLILSKELARAQRYGSSGTLALLRLRNVDALLRPDAYHQHETLISHAMATIAANVRGSDTACYLGDLHLAFVFPYASSEQSQIALSRLRTALAPLPQRRCPSLSTGPLDWDAIHLEYPATGTDAAELLDIAATALGATAQQRVAALEKERALKQAQLQRLGYTP